MGEPLDTVKTDISEVRGYLYNLQRTGLNVPAPIMGAIDRVLSHHTNMRGNIDAAYKSLVERLCGYDGA